MYLNEFFAENPRIAIAFSGGTDSSYLLYAAKKAGCDARAYYVKTQFQPEFELRDARRIAGEQKIEMKVIDYDVLSVVQVRENSAMRCYFCKRALFSRIAKAAADDGFAVLADGTNASDDASDRPGMRALRELRVMSPLRDAGLTKSRIRELSREAGLFTWNKPAYACLATRVATDTAIDVDTLKKVERAEDCLREMGFSDLRVRVFHQAARIQLTESDFLRAAERRGDIVNALGKDFPDIMLDMKTR